MNGCEVVGCSKTVSKAGHSLCYDHWKAERDGKVTRCPTCKRLHDGSAIQCPDCIHKSTTTPAPTATASEPENDGAMLSSTKIGEHFGLSSIKMNLILAELGWIEKYVKGWVPTDRGNMLGAQVREMRNGVPYVVWPQMILQSQALKRSIGEQSVGSASADRKKEPSAKADPTSDKAKSDDFRTKYEAEFLTSDGHWVRSRAEVLIDNWLYMQGIVHAYERRLPIEEDCYCGFYIPKGKVFIEYWGLEADPKYRERQATKRAIYTKYNLPLIELTDADIERLDDVLPRYLLKFGIESA